MTAIIGWDIGGAHLKAALALDGEIAAAEQVSCPLWLGMDHLTQAWWAATLRLGNAQRHAVTMTGELAEIFPSRREGVAAICQAAATLADTGAVSFYAGPLGFLDRENAMRAWEHVASANWHGSAVWAGRRLPAALFIDIGSTTTDIVPIANGQPVAHAMTDAERLENGTLVYTGVTRTSLMALASEAPFGGRRQRLMAENFATAADIYRLSGALSAESDSYPASDGRSKSAADCRARIARMFGRDAAEAPDAVWDGAAHYFRERQLSLIGEAIAQVLSAGGLPREAPFVAAGAGHFLVPELARRFGRPATAFAELVPASDELRAKVGLSAPAVAMALLG